jgi:hypothetical protein
VRSLSLIALLVSCAAPDPAVAPAVVEAPAAELGVARAGLVHTLEKPLVPGTSTRFRVAGAVPGETVYIVRSFTGTGDGPCPGIVGGACMEILNPIKVQGSNVADASGIAFIDMPVPMGAPIGALLHTQAVAIRGVGGGDSAISDARSDDVRPANGVVDVADADLGAAPEGCDVAQRVAIRNAGGATLTITDIAIDGPFALTAPRLPYSLGADKVLNVLVQADMTGDGPISGSLMVSSDDPAGDAMITLDAEISADAACPDTTAGEVAARYGAVDLTVLLDTTCSMGGVVDATTEAFGGIAGDVAAFAPDLTFGVATYDDYNDAGFGSGLDKPFILLTQQTSDASRAQSALDSIALHGGADGPESTHEALFQTLTGTGYDQDCDGAPDIEDDVPAFIASPSDPFGGSAPSARVDGIAGTGEIGGVGYRDGTLRFIAYATDNELRDPADGYASPGGCPADATSDDVVAAAADVGAKFVGVYASSFAPTARAQMVDLAERTGSVGDVDGDGDLEPAVIDFVGADAADLRTWLVAGLRSLLPPEADFEGTLELVVVDDPDGIVAGVSPASVDGAAYGEVLPFDITLDGVTVGGGGEGVSKATLALFHDGLRLGRVVVYGVPMLD